MTARLLLPTVLAVLAIAAAPPAYPPFAGAYQARTTDERGLWLEADEQERVLRDSEFVIRDPQLNAYVRGVLCRAVGPERCGAVRLYIVRIPAFNADMSPNGMMRVWTGMLLRVRNEAELAAVLGHEFAHFEERHTLAAFRQRRTASDLMVWTSLLGNSGALIGSAALGSMFRFSREQETAADVRGFGYLAASGYRTGAFADVWERLMDEADATSVGRRQTIKRYRGVAFFDDHPTDLARATYLRAMAARQGDTGDTGEARFRAAMKSWQMEFLADQVQLNDFAGTECLLGQMADGNWTAELLYARAELYRQRGHPRDLVNAAQYYRDAIAKGSATADAYRGLGMSLMRSGDDIGGREALREYLRLRPDAGDKPMITALLQ
jgi:beta-barrel assembly-enhancing protease